ncbi:helix-turn-helix transcriptional regulator [Paenibacillus sp. FSL R5-0345]|uniref:helix-turn-helix transcriptional regulator n=1 Tax=unclassified Paenibacillus TaxID=185978 RepID=UPI0004F6084C|nr:WYL domain-containing protein [Paenibacillus sp. FSL R5-0345]AIQ36121.1 transcriptional regulator [Paenibacillus sp. FSL R5-0345]
MRLHRLIAILLLVESRGKMKANDLAQALETSVRSIYRDIDVLAEAGIPLLSTPGPNGGISLMKGYTVNLSQLHEEDVINLYLTGMGIHTGGHTHSGLKLKTTLLKLEKTLPASYQTDIQKAQKRFYFDNTPWWSERLEIPCLESIRAAVWRSHKLWIEYHKINGVISNRKLQPYGLVVKKEEWYLIAYCEDAEQIRTFKCERIATTQLIEEEYAIPQDFSLEGHWKQQEREFKQACKEEEIYPVLIRTNKSRVASIHGLEIMNRVEEGDQITLTVNMYNYESACTNVWGILGQAEIMEPLKLRQYVKEQVNLIQGVYN